MKIFESSEFKALHDVQICFQVGEYRLPSGKGVKIQGMKNIKITGCGAGTRIIAKEIEAALSFDLCTNVIVRDIHAETGISV